MSLGTEVVVYFLLITYQKYKKDCSLTCYIEIPLVNI